MAPSLIPGKEATGAFTHQNILLNIVCFCLDRSLNALSVLICGWYFHLQYRFPFSDTEFLQRSSDQALPWVLPQMSLQENRGASPWAPTMPLRCAQLSEYTPTVGSKMGSGRKWGPEDRWEENRLGAQWPRFYFLCVVSWTAFDLPGLSVFPLLALFSAKWLESRVKLVRVLYDL